MQRRLFLGLGTSLFAAAALGGWRLGRGGAQPLLLSARDDAAGHHYVVGYRLDGRCQFATPVAERCHAAVPHPSLPLALFVGRRPSRRAYLIDTRDGRLLQTLASPPARHFFGHALFHRHGALLYATENDTDEPGRGVIGVWRLQGARLQRLSELSSHGIGPHQLSWLPDGETLAVANGGIRTEADSREPLNLDAMEPSLVLLHRDGTLLAKETPTEARNSVRHLAVAADGSVVCGQQYQGEAQDAVPLLLIKRPGQPLRPFPLGEAQRQAMRQYTASLAIHDRLRLLAVTAPRGNRLFVWDLDRAELRLEAPLADCAGVAACRAGFVVSAGQERCRLLDCRQREIRQHTLALPAARWDNHLSLA